MSDHIPNSLCLLLLLLLSSMQAPSQNSPLCAYHPSGSELRFSVSHSPPASSQRRSGRRLKGAGLAVLRAAAVVKNHEFAAEQRHGVRGVPHFLTLFAVFSGPPASRLCLPQFVSAFIFCFVFGKYFLFGSILSFLFFARPCLCKMTCIPLWRGKRAHGGEAVWVGGQWSAHRDGSRGDSGRLPAVLWTVCITCV